MTEAHQPAQNNYRLYISLLKEVSVADPTWKHQGKVYSAAELLSEFEQNTAAAEQYARTILYNALEGLFRPTKLVVPGPADLDMTVTPGTTFIEQFRRLPPENTSVANDVMDDDGRRDACSYRSLRRRRYDAAERCIAYHT